MAAVFDTFTGSAGTLLSARSADTGQSWVKFYSVGPSDDFALNGSALGGVAPNSTNFTYYYVNDTVGVNARVRATITRNPNPANSASSLILRYVDGANHYRVDFISNAVQIVRSTNVGTFQQPVIASATIAFATNTPTDVTVDVVGRTITVRVGFNVVLTYTDSNALGDGLQASGLYGIGANNNTIFDNFSADRIDGTDGVFLRDRFTNGTASSVTLLNHLPDVGPAWVAPTGWGSVLVPSISANSASDAHKLGGQSSNTPAIYITNQVAPSSDFVINADIGRAATASVCDVGFIFRASNTERTGYYVRFAASSIGVYRYNNGAITTLGTASIAFPVSGNANTFPVQIECRGSQIVVYSQGVLRFDITDTAPLAGPGYVGIYSTYYSLYDNYTARTAASVPAIGTGSAAGTVAITGRGSRVMGSKGTGVGVNASTGIGSALKKGNNWPATTLSDTFTETVSTPLTSHLPEVGGSWLLMSGTGGTGGMSVAPSNGRAGSASSSDNFYYNLTDAQTNSTITATLYRGNAGGWGGFSLRNDPVGKNAYYCYWDSNSVTIAKLVNGVRSTLASTPGGIGSSNLPFLCTFTVVDNHLTVTKDGVVQIDYIDVNNSVPNAGYPGMYAYSFVVGYDDISATVPVISATATATGFGTGAAEGQRVQVGRASASGTTSSNVVQGFTRTATFTTGGNVGTATGRGVVIKTMYGDAQGHSNAQAGGLTIDYSTATATASGSTGTNARALPIYERIATASGTSSTSFTGRGFPANEGDFTLKNKSTVSGAGVTIKAVRGIAEGDSNTSIKTQLRRQGNGSATGRGTATAQGRALLINGGDGTAMGKATAAGVGHQRRAASFSATGSSDAAGDGFPRFLAAKATAQGRASARVFNGPIIIGNAHAAGTSSTANWQGGRLYTSQAVAEGFAIAYASSQNFKGIGSAAGTSTASATPVFGEIVAGTGTSTGTSTAVGVGEKVIGADGHAIGTSTANATGVTIQQGDGLGIGTGTASAVGITIIHATATAEGRADALAEGITIITVVGSALGASSAQGITEATVEALGTASGGSTAVGIGSGFVHAVATAHGVSDSNIQTIAIESAEFSVSGTSTAEATGAGMNFAVGVGHAVGGSKCWGTASVVPTDRVLNTSVKAQPLYWAGEEQGNVRVDDWPNPSRDLKTVMIHTDDFVGTITIQASLHGVPGEDDWFDVKVETFEQAGTMEDKARNRFFNSRDRFIWMRAKIEKVKGRIDRIMVI